MGVRGIRAAAVLLCAAVVCGCSAPPTAPGAAPVPGPCDRRDLTVTVDAELAIHVRNAGRSACHLYGTPAVEMKVGRVDGPIPTTDVTLAPADEFVQPQMQVAGASACAAPLSGGLPRPGLWTIVVQDQTVHPASPNGQLVAEMVNCAVVTLPPGHRVSP